MNISYNWLKELIDIDLTVEETAAALTRVGLAVEGIHPHGDDHVLDIDLTSNRPDCLSHLGVARELAVTQRTELKRRETTPALPMPPVLAHEIVRIKDSDLCHRFTASIIRNVKIGPSPQWLVDRLESIGERSINNVADITNYVMHELGQPMHAFDLDKLSENRIIIRRAKAGETITTLDEVERKLEDTMLAICDAQKPVAIAGVMGGLESSITDKTVNVLLEVAYFKRENIKTTSRSLGLATEASYRFERGVDIENLVTASNRATDLICDLAGGERVNFIDSYPIPHESTSVESPNVSAAVRRLTGLSVDTTECDRILKALGISRSDSRYNSPSWRYDIAIEEDLVEEVARHYGYEKIADELPPAYGAGEYQAGEVKKRLLRQGIADIGFDEAITYSFIDSRHDETFVPIPGVLNDKLDDKYVSLEDAVIEGSVRMRPTILPGLLDAVRLNLNHQRRDLRLFEIGKVFGAGVSENGLPTETEIFSIAMTGSETTEGRLLPAREIDFYDAKGAVEAVLNAVGIAAKFEPRDVSYLRQGQTASVKIDDEIVGYVGRLSDETAAGYKFKRPVFTAELNLGKLLSAQADDVLYTPLARYPSITRDVSLVAEKNLTLDKIRQIILEQGIELCRNIEFVDVYEGAGLETNERSITIRLEYRNDERTLIENEVDEVHQQILDSLANNLGISPRV